MAVAVIIEDADVPRTDIGGGRLAAPIAKAVMEAALERDQFRPADEIAHAGP